MRKRWTAAASLVGASSFLLVGCAKPPQQEIDAAMAGLKAAEQAEAPKYAPESWDKAQRSVNALHAEIEVQSSKFVLFRSFARTKELTTEIQTFANEAKDAGIEGSRRDTKEIRDQTQEMITNIEMTARRLQQGKPTRRTLASLREVEGFKSSLRSVEEQLDKGNLSGARAQAYSLREEIAPIAKNLYWNSWFRQEGIREAATEAKPGHAFDVNFDLAPFDYSSVWASAAVTSPVDPVFRRELTAVTTGTLAVVAKPFLLGRGLSFLQGEARTRVVEINVERLREPAAGLDLNRDLPAFADQIRALRITVGVRADEPGCAEVMLAVWNRELNRRPSYVVRPVSVGTGAATNGCNGATKTSASIITPLSSLVGSPFAPQPDAALQLFELAMPGDPQARTQVVFATSAGVTDALSWTLSRDLPRYLTGSTGLPYQLEYARRKHDYSKVGQDLTKVVFDADSPQGRESAKRALDELEKLVASNRSPQLFVSLVDLDGKSYVLPFGLLYVGGKTLGTTANISQPLPTERLLDSGSCIGSWTAVLPATLGGLDSPETTLRPLSPTLPDAIRDWPGFASYAKGKPEDASEGKPKGTVHGEGLLLLAHHTASLITFVPGTAESLIVPEDFRRSYPPGSVAVLAACTVGRLSDDNKGLPLLSALNDGGIDAAILSPFDVDSNLGARFALQFAHAVEEARVNKESAQLGELFHRAANAVLEDRAAGAAADQTIEFILAGNTRLALCK